LNAVRFIDAHPNANVVAISAPGYIQWVWIVLIVAFSIIFIHDIFVSSDAIITDCTSNDSSHYEAEVNE
jgi:hypothetical protein